MRQTAWSVALVGCLGLAGCDDARPPKYAIPSATNREKEAAPPAVYGIKPTTTKEKKHRYQGKTAEEWAQLLSAKSHEEIWKACLALRVLGAEGRPHLLEGIQHASPETRRICLATLDVSDFRAYGEEGRRWLVHLAGDTSDMRIRERANQFLMQWDRSLPAP
jgi:hypothetical protein